MTASGLLDGEWVVELVKPAPSGGHHTFRAYGYPTEADARLGMEHWKRKLPGYQEGCVRPLREGEGHL